ncbi:MAG TPA: flagellar brake protein [Chloroflexota bacterium]|nr:flagellar brake protein [Chloroflexota bacterium]
MGARDVRADLKTFGIGLALMVVPDAVGPSADDERKEYSTRITDITTDALVVAMPTLNRTLLELPLNSGITAYFQRHGFRYGFRATVSSVRRAPLPIMVLTDIGEVAKAERRLYVRVEACVEPLEIVEIGDDAAKPLDRRSSLVVNMSAGGLGIVCRRPLAEGAMVKVVVQLPKGFGTIDCEAEVIRCTQLELYGIRKWRAGLSFRKMHNGDRDMVTGFVLSQQQSLRRRGLL